jgi:hypothetical protein
MHLLAATILSPHGFRWHRIAAALNQTLLFSSEQELNNLLKSYISTLIEEVQPYFQQQLEILYPERNSKFPKITDAMYGYDAVPQENGDLNHLIAWQVLYDQHLLRTSSLSPSLDASAYWISEPKSALQMVALMILAVPASSAPVERIFSHSGLICSPKRTSLKDDLLAALVKAKYNCDTMV